MFIVLSILAVVVWLALSIFLCCALRANPSDIFEPRYWRRITCCNWFGVTVLVIVTNILLFPLALCYWFYVICHI